MAGSNSFGIYWIWARIVTYMIVHSNKIRNKPRHFTLANAPLPPLQLHHNPLVLQLGKRDFTSCTCLVEQVVINVAVYLLDSSKKVCTSAEFT